MKKFYHFDMCRYCGKRITTAFNRRGKRQEGGHYCSSGCVNAVHGFDNRIESERSNGVVSFLPLEHDHADTNVAEPWRGMEKTEENIPAPTKSIADTRLLRAMRIAREIDPLLPSVLSYMTDGMSQTQAAKCCGVPRQTVTDWIIRLKIKTQNVTA